MKYCTSVAAPGELGLSCSLVLEASRDGGPPDFIHRLAFLRWAGFFSVCLGLAIKETIYYICHLILPDRCVLALYSVYSVLSEHLISLWNKGQFSEIKKRFNSNIHNFHLLHGWLVQIPRKSCAISLWLFAHISWCTTSKLHMNRVFMTVVVPEAQQCIAVNFQTLDLSLSSFLCQYSNPKS